jgi:hypothetical protein
MTDAPDPDVWEAQQVLNLLVGEIVHADDLERHPQHIY